MLSHKIGTHFAKSAVFRNIDLLGVVASMIGEKGGILALAMTNKACNEAIRRSGLKLISVCHLHSGSVSMAQWSLSMGLPMSYLALYASGLGALHVLKWLRAQKPSCPLSGDVLGKAALNGHLEVLQWLRAQNPPCPWSADACGRAADNGHLEVLQWLRAQDPPCPWSEYACSSAAENGHLEVLQWLRAQNPPCPW